MKRRPRRLTVHQRIVRNAERGRGVRLTRAEVYALALDPSVYDRAWMDDENANGIDDNECNPPRTDAYE